MAFEKISLSPLSLLHHKSSFLWSLYSEGLRASEGEERREESDRQTEGEGEAGEGKNIGEMREEGEKVGERQSHSLFTALQCQSHFSQLC